MDRIALLAPKNDSGDRIKLYIAFNIHNLDETAQKFWLKEFEKDPNRVLAVFGLTPTTLTIN